MGISLKLQLEIYPDGDPNFYPGDDNWIKLKRLI
jgi:hypothetical protein